MSESRQLAAIMFADIVGFSGLMQSDEKRALALRQKLKQELESAVNTHNGTMVKWMGDGVMCTFDFSPTLRAISSILNFEMSQYS